MPSATFWPHRDNSLWEEAQSQVVAAWLNRSDTSDEIRALSEWIARESEGAVDISQ